MASPSHLFFFFNDTATTEIYTLSLHDALPISCRSAHDWRRSSENRPRSCPPLKSPHESKLPVRRLGGNSGRSPIGKLRSTRSEEHTSELQSPCNLVCRLLLEKKKQIAMDNQVY